MNVLITSEELDALKTFIGHFNRKNSYRVIRILHKHPDGITASDIIDKLGISQPETTNTLRLLHKHGFTTTCRKGKFSYYKPRYKKFNLLSKLHCLLIKTKTNGKV